MMQKILIYKGGTGSGHYEHAGRPGEVGGSAPGKTVGYRTGDPSYAAFRQVRHHDKVLRDLIASGASSDALAKAQKTYEKAQARYAELHGERWINPKFGKEPSLSRYQFGRGVVPSDVSPYNTPDDPKGTNALAQPLRGDTYTNHPEDPVHWRSPAIGVREQAKADIVSNISQQSGLPSAEVNAGVAQWAHTANDSDMRSLSLQEAASEEFGTPLSAWQQKSIAHVRSGTQLRESMYYEDNPTAKPGSYANIQSDNDRPINNWSREQERTFIRTMYDNTQSEFARLGYKPDDTVTLYRGYKPDGTFSLGETLDYVGNPMESWSVGYDVSNSSYFSGGGIVIAMQVPLRNVVATARTGFGCLSEGEFVVNGAAGNNVCVVVRN